MNLAQRPMASVGPLIRTPNAKLSPQRQYVLGLAVGSVVPLKHWFFERLVHYYHILSERRSSLDSVYCSSAQLARPLNMDDTQVRKDLASIGVRGAPRVGFKRDEICTAIRTRLGFDQPYTAVIIGAGHLGTALAAYPGFAAYGLKIIAAFDKNPERVGCKLGEVEVRPIDELARAVALESPRLAILTVPSNAAQEIADLVVSLGVEAIWNFAPASVQVHDSVYVRDEHISAGLGEIAYHLKREKA